MSENIFYLRHKNIIIGVFTFRGNRKMYCPVKENADRLSGGIGYPLGLYPLKVRDEYLRLDREYYPDERSIDLWFMDRIFPPDRDGVENLLKMYDLVEYEPWKIAAKHYAINMNDFYWMSRDEDDNYYEIHPRGLKEIHGVRALIPMKVDDEEAAHVYYERHHPRFVCEYDDDAYVIAHKKKYNSELLNKRELDKVKMRLNYVKSFNLKN